MNGSGGERGEGSPLPMNYDYFDAPQYIDFAQLAQNDDPNADAFFETHREEDDFLSIDNISPTVQLLTEQNILYDNENEVNQAVTQAGMEDIKVTYYASPLNNKKSGGRKTSSLNSTNGSFHTPDGDSQDKENFTPPPDYYNVSNGTKDGSKSAKKLSQVAPQLPEGKVLFGQSEAGKWPEINNQEVQDAERKPTHVRDSLLSQLEKLTILSSDEEDAAVETIEESYFSPTGTPMKVNDSYVESLLNTPGARKPKSAQFSAISSEKRDFFQGLSIDSPMQIEALPAESKVTAFDETFDFEANSRKQSFIVKPFIGQEMTWNQEDDRNHVVVANEQLEGALSLPLVGHGGESAQESVECVENEDIDDGDNTLTSSFDSYLPGQVEEFISAVESTVPISSKDRRASSCNDLTKLLLSSKGSKNPLSNIPRMGLTIPHSPEASKRPPSKCRSSIKSELPTSKHAIVGSSAKPSAPLQKIRTFMPTVPYKGAMGGPTRQPLKATHYVSLAEAITKFQKNTPDRFRTLPKGRVPIKRSSSVDVKAEKRTRSPSPARSPNRLIPNGSNRSRANSTASQIAMGLGGLKNSQPYQKKTTIPQPFKLSSAKPRTDADAKIDVPDFKFKARPVPSKLLHGGPAGIKERPQAKVTLAMAPHFASDDRIRERNEKKAQSALHSPTSTATRPGTAQSLHTAAGRLSRISVAGGRAPAPEPPKAPTVQKPFSFDQRDRQTLRRKEEKMKQDLEEDKKTWDFHAQPLPSFTSKLPKKRPMPLTSVEPFNLTLDKRGAAYKEILKEKLDEEERRSRMMATFYANPPVVLHKPAFEPEHPARPPLEHLQFQLNTEKRAAERENFEAHLKQKEIEDEERKREEQTRLEELQRQEELEKRRLIVHKAQPFRHPKQFEIKASGKALTIPQSPAFHPLPSQRRLTPTKNDNTNSSSGEEVALILLFCTVFYAITLVDKFPQAFLRLFRNNKK